jgi:hypothetical protein
VGKKSFPIRNGGRYEAVVEGPEVWGDEAHALNRQAVLEAARRLLTR